MVENGEFKGETNEAIRRISDTLKTFHAENKEEHRIILDQVTDLRLWRAKLFGAALIVSAVVSLLISIGIKNA